MFYDRKEAGQKLAKVIENCKFCFANYRKIENSVILALPRGGVIVAKEIADTLQIPLDIIITRKIGYPGNPEYAIGAIGESGKLVMGNELISNEINREYVKKEIEIEKKEIKRRLSEYKGNKQGLILKNKTIILVDDGLATGLTMKAAVKEVKVRKPSKIIIAVPVAPPGIIAELKKEVNQIICLETPSSFLAVGNFYLNFPQITDREVIKILKSGS